MMDLEAVTIFRISPELTRLQVEMTYLQNKKIKLLLEKIKLQWKNNIELYPFDIAKKWIYSIFILCFHTLNSE